MSIYYQDLHNTLYNIDFRKNDLPDESIQCVVTSPPYWGLRKYSGEQDLIWGDEKDCQHNWIDSSIPKSGGVGNYEVGRVGNAKARSDSHDRKESNTCSLCGAWKGAYGLEPTPEMYIEHTIEILREIRRVLRKDGVVFWNIGDSYATNHAEVGTIDRETGWTSATALIDMKERGRTSTKGHKTLKPKDLCLIPFRVAIAAQEDGWWVRSDIIWSKPNPMPESVTDRPTNSHEHILMLTKSAKYYWDQEAVREPNLPQSIERAKHAWKQHKTNNMVAIHNVNTDRMGERFVPEAGRNIRDVWEFPTQPYPEAHFAVFPEKLPEICIKAATPEVGCCSKCGAPWERIVEKREYPPEVFTKARRPDDDLVRSSVTSDGKGSGGKMQKYIDEHPLKTLGWQPTCKCTAEKVPSLVLDPFAGAGTTLWVAKKLNRRTVGYELSKEYCELIVERNRQQVMV